MDKDIKFYDTDVLLQNKYNIFQQEEKFIISYITIESLLNIIKFSNKESDARLILNLLDKHRNKYDLITHREEYEKSLMDVLPLKDYRLRKEDGFKILSDAYHCNNTNYIDRIIFVTANRELANFANLCFGDGMIEYQFSFPKYL